jgi:hypothetical protein
VTHVTQVARLVSHSTENPPTENVKHAQKLVAYTELNATATSTNVSSRAPFVKDITSKSPEPLTVKNAKKVYS